MEMSNTRELNQLKNHLVRIEEICIELIRGRKDVEEHYEYVIDDLKEQLRIANTNLANDQVAVTSDHIFAHWQDHGIKHNQETIPTDQQIALEKREQLKMKLESLKEANSMCIDRLPNYQQVIRGLGSNETPISSQ